MYLLDLASDLKDFAEKLVGPATEELGLIIGEKVRLLRLKSSIKTFKRAKEILLEAGYSEPKPVDLKTLVPLLEGCSLEDEDSELIDKWAGLLANASSIGLKLVSYPHILNQISPVEAKLLDKIYEHAINNIPREKWNKEGISHDNLFNSFTISVNELIIYLDNLYRLELCQPIGSSPLTLGGISLSPKTSNIVCVTYLGADFVEACKGPKILSQ